MKLAQPTLESPFNVRAISALCISIAADALDYVGAPIFALPVIGDIADGIVISMLYRLTGSKISTAFNVIEFIPFIGDMIPTYTISTLMWILRESRKRKDTKLHLVARKRQEMITSIGYPSGASTAFNLGGDRLRTRFRRARAVFRSRLT
jgi:hypothetical protein